MRASSQDSALHSLQVAQLASSKAAANTCPVNQAPLQRPAMACARKKEGSPPSAASRRG